MFLIQRIKMSELRYRKILRHDPDEAFTLAVNGFPEIVRFLVDTYVFSEDFIYERTVDACGNGQIEIVEFLLDRFDQDHTLYMFLEFAALSGNSQLVEILFDRGGAQVTEEVFNNAVQSGNLETVRLVFREGGESFIHEGFVRAASEGHLEIVRFLLNRGADIHSNGDEALISAASHGFVDVVRLLLDTATFHGMNVVLEQAISGGDYDTVKLLLDRGADPVVIIRFIHRGSPYNPELDKLFSLKYKNK
jgi:ankyrin repeat protein